jgi:hypothetical protein
MTIAVCDVFAMQASVRGAAAEADCCADATPAD